MTSLEINRKSDTESMFVQNNAFMQALVLERPGILTKRVVERPEPHPDGVLLKTRAVSVCSTDISYFHGNLYSDGDSVILGHEYVGEIVEVGRQMPPDLLGRRMCYFGQTDFGGFAEYRAIRPVFPGERKVAPFSTRRFFHDDERAAAVLVPDTIPDQHAPLLEPITAVLRAVLHHPPHIGARVLILGGGPCGAIAGCLLQQCFGVDTISLLERNQKRAAIARHKYCDDVFDNATELECAEGSRANFDYIFDALPTVTSQEEASDPRRAAMRVSAPGAKYVLYGASEKLQHFDTWLLLAKGISLHTAPFDVNIIPIAKTAMVMKTALRALSSGTIDPSWLITREVHFADTARIVWAFENHEKNPDLKTVIRFD